MGKKLPYSLFLELGDQIYEISCDTEVLEFYKILLLADNMQSFG